MVNYRSIPLNGYLKDNAGDVFVTQDGGFGGMITQLRCFDRALPLNTLIYYINVVLLVL